MGKTEAMMQAHIHLDTEHRVGPIDRRIFGGFLEHLGRAVYEGVYDPESPLADEHGFRLDVAESLRAAMKQHATATTSALCRPPGVARGLTDEDLCAFPVAAIGPGDRALETVIDQAVRRGVHGDPGAAPRLHARAVRPLQGARLPATPMRREQVQLAECLLVASTGLLPVGVGLPAGGK
jgi:hypothetical protein